MQFDIMLCVLLIAFHSYLIYCSHSIAYFVLAANHAIELQSGIVIGVPIPEEDAMDDALVGEAINVAVQESMYASLVLKGMNVKWL